MSGNISIGTAAAALILLPTVGCGFGSVEVTTFSDEKYADALEFLDENGEPCEPDLATFEEGNGDQGGDTSMGVPGDSPDEDRHGGYDNQFTGNGDGTGEETQDGNGSEFTDGAQSDAGEATGEPSDPSGEGVGAGCDAFGCCASDMEITRTRETTRCRCRIRLRGADELVLPECCETEEAESLPPGETDDDPPPIPPEDSDIPADDPDSAPDPGEDDPSV